jgi:hypothetical protein
MRLAVIAALILISFVPPLAAKSIHPSTLQPVENGDRYILAEPYVFVEKAATFTLAAGVYTVVQRNATALFLLRNDKCLGIRVVPPKNPAGAWSDNWECGIYLPHNPEKGAAFFRIRPKQEQEPDFGLLIDAIIRDGYGRYDFPTARHDDALLRQRLQPAKAGEISPAD